MSTLLGLAVPFLIEKVWPHLEKLIPDPAERARLQADLQRQAAEADARLAEAQRDMAVADSRSDNLLAKTWRPVLSYALIVLFVWGVLLRGLVETAFQVSIPFDEDLFLGLAETWAIVYGGGRSLQAIAASMARGRR